MRILVVDDEPMVAETLTLIFRQNGFEVDTAHSAEQALAFLRHLTPDLILCDIDMPVRDGISLMTQLGHDLPACPILVLTGFYSALSRVRDCANSLSQHVTIVTKPCQPTDLLRTADDLLKLSAQAA